jgi:hypothetical protein
LPRSLLAARSTEAQDRGAAAGPLIGQVGECSARVP